MVLTSQSFNIGVGGKFVMIPSRTIFISDSGIIYATQKKRKGKMDFARMDDLVKTIGKTVIVENFTLSEPDCRSHAQVPSILKRRTR